jgi:hypothetical protein
MRAVEAILIMNQAHGIIEWPSADCAIQSALIFESAYGFPGILECRPNLQRLKNDLYTLK